MSDIFSWLAYSWVVVYEHLTKKQYSVLTEVGYVTVVFQILVIIGLVVML